MLDEFHDVLKKYDNEKQLNDKFCESSNSVLKSNRGLSERAYELEEQNEALEEFATQKDYEITSLELEIEEIKRQHEIEVKEFNDRYDNLWQMYIAKCKDNSDLVQVITDLTEMDD